MPVASSADTNVREVTMANILASVAGRNPEVGYASQRYAEAYARLIAARVLWLPAINAGIGWNNHAGPIQATTGQVNNISRSSLTAGLGVQTIGAGSPVVPGLFANFHAADAIFQPKIANRAAAARDAAVRTTNQRPAARDVSCLFGSSAGSPVARDCLEHALPRRGAGQSHGRFCPRWRRKRSRRRPGRHGAVHSAERSGARRGRDSSCVGPSRRTLQRQPVSNPAAAGASHCSGGSGADRHAP